MPPSPTAVPVATATVAPAEAPTQLPPGSIDPALAAALQRILDETVADGKIPGAVLAVQIPGYEPWAGASGYADVQRAQPMTPATQVRIASISKVFTAVVVMQLVEEGRLDLDAPIATWYPGLVPYGDAITVRALLNHTAGLYDYLEDKHFLARAFQAPEYRWPPEELVAYAAQQQPVFLPGTQDAWDYSSTNYVLLGMIVEQVTGNPLAYEMRQRVLIPAGLRHTYFPPDEAVEGVQARGYRHERDQTNISLSFAYATANMVSTVGDVQRFGEALFGGRLLRPETLEMMLTFENGKGQYNMPALEYGLGVMRNVLPVGPDASGRARPAAASTVLGHIGGFGGFRSALWHAPESGITIALGVNQGATDPNILATRVFDAILAAQGR
ncbi:MAG TPA: serine hydrolase domain-containing protein [Roseiflexaceae bacterium]|nr:serine hydrolase domain-containing protein [Roseiflexaceae bacterium]